MRHTTTSPVAALVGFGVLSPAWAVTLKAKVDVEIERAQFHAGMNPGTDMCAAQHPHIGAVVENRADVRLGRIKVAGNVFDGDGALMGTATVVGRLIEDVERHELAVVAAPAK